MELDFVGFVKYFVGAAPLAVLFYFVMRKATESGLNLFVSKQIEELRAAKQKELEQFRHDLGQATVAAQFDYQRKLHDFQKYSEQRHAAYVEIFKQATLLSNTLLVLSTKVDGIREAVTSDRDGTSIEFELESYGLRAAQITDLRNVFFAAKSVGEPDPVSHALDTVAHSLTGDGYSQLQKFENAVASHALYLSPAVERASQKFYLVVSHFLLAVFDTKGEVRYREAFDGIKKAMKAELSIGDYETPPEQRLLEKKRAEMEQHF